MSFYLVNKILLYIDADGWIEHLLPICKDKECKNSSIFVYKDNTVKYLNIFELNYPKKIFYLKWSELEIDFHEYRFVPPNSDKSNFLTSQKITMKFADYDLNGFIDLLVVMQEPK